MSFPIDRRRFLHLAGGAAMLAACAGRGLSMVAGTSPAVVEAERRRRRPGAPVVNLALTAAAVDADLGGRVVPTWAYGPAPGAPGVRIRAGEVLRATLTNSLPAATTIHWHGIALRNDMDGVPDLTQKSIPPGGTFVYEFTAPNPGTYFFHPHSGMQLDRGLYSPLIVEDPNEPLKYDAEFTIVLDDWLDGAPGTPDQKLAELVKGGMAGMNMGGGATNMGGGGMNMAGVQSDALGGDSGDVRYPIHLLNGRMPADRPTFTVAPNARVRLRVINAGSDTAYRFAVGGHRMTVTHTDGFPVTPLDVDTLILGMAERYDVVVQVQSGAWPLVAAAEGKDGLAAAVLRTTDATATAPPPADLRPPELKGQLLDDIDLRADPSVSLVDRRADRTHQVALTVDAMQYRWLINGKVHGEGGGHGAELDVRQGERVQLEYTNKTTMWHPMHLHGHTFQRIGGRARKDTIKVLPGRTVDVIFDADNPGQWMLHCHNTYHLMAGMGSVVSYVS